MREYMQRRYRARMATAIERLGGRCIQCGSTESLEFDHIDPSTKLMDISQAVTYSTRVFEAELAKCQLLCASHHQQKTLQQNGMTLARGTHGTLSALRYCRPPCDACRAAKADYNRQHYLSRR